MNITATKSLLDKDVLTGLSKHLRLTNYLSAAQIYLKSNTLLQKNLTKNDVKERLLGHWGTVPGINFIWATLGLIIKKYNQEMMMIVGPGHGYPAILSNLYLDGSLGEFYPEYKINLESAQKLVRNFSWPGGFPSHANPATPGVILEGGELGYSLATAFGAVLDNPDLIAACIVGDGEAETGPLATAWHSNKFLNPKTSGAVLPIVHINGYKISGPTIYGTMDNDELTHLFKGYGYNPIIVEGDFIYEPMIVALEKAYSQIKEIQKEARINNNINKPKWPVILLKTKKGWTGPKLNKGKLVEDSFRSHGVPLEKVHSNNEEFESLKAWLQSYKVNELFTEDFEINQDILNVLPEGKLRMGMNDHANSQKLAKLNLPALFDFRAKFDVPTKTLAKNTTYLADFLAYTLKENPKSFRLFCPDETESNELHKVFDYTKRAYIWPTKEGAENISQDGRVMEMLSEHTLMGWLQGYIMTGRSGIFVSYEAFMMIIASMVDQYAKFLSQTDKVKWRGPTPSLNFVLTSTSWRQDHNGFSHQNPGFISDLLNKYSEHVNIHFPPDANTLLVTIKDSLRETNKINIIIAGKRDLPQYLSLDEARAQTKSGIERWKWAGNLDKDPDIIFTSTGDYATKETLAALKILKEKAPYLKTRYINVSELTCFGIGDNRNLGRINISKFNELFALDRDILYSYHGYPEDIKQLIFGHTAADRFTIFGYQEQGTTTTPFDMMVVNQCSRYHLAIDAISKAAKVNPEVRDNLSDLIHYFQTLLMKHHLYIKEHGTDMPEIKNFKF